MATRPSSVPDASMARNAAWASAIWPARAFSTAASRCWLAVCARASSRPSGQRQHCQGARRMSPGERALHRSTMRARELAVKLQARKP